MPPRNKADSMHKTDIAIEAGKLTPAAPVTVMSFLGYSVADWASILTMIYVLLLIGHFCWTHFISPRPPQRPSSQEKQDGFPP